MTQEELSREIEEEKPDVAGVNVFTCQLRSAMHTCRKTKSVSSSTKVVVSGLHIYPQHREGRRVLGEDVTEKGCVWSKPWMICRLEEKRNRVFKVKTLAVFSF